MKKYLNGRTMQFIYNQLMLDYFFILDNLKLMLN